MKKAAYGIVLPYAAFFCSVQDRHHVSGFYWIVDRADAVFSAFDHIPVIVPAVQDICGIFNLADNVRQEVFSQIFGGGHEHVVICHCKYLLSIFCKLTVALKNLQKQSKSPIFTHFLHFLCKEKQTFQCLSEISSRGEMKLIFTKNTQFSCFGVWKWKEIDLFQRDWKGFRSIAFWIDFHKLTFVCEWGTNCEWQMQKYL